MAVPDRLRIPLDDDTFENVGRLTDGTQFLAYVTGAFPGGVKYPTPGDDSLEQKRWLAVLHRFDPGGNYIGSETRLGGYDAEGRVIAGERAFQKLEELFAEMTVNDRAEFCDIWVRPFAADIDGVIHGLFYGRHEEDDSADAADNEYILLEPPDIMFHPPWDSGEYST